VSDEASQAAKQFRLLVDTSRQSVEYASEDAKRVVLGHETTRDIAESVKSDLIGRAAEVILASVDEQTGSRSESERAVIGLVKDHEASASVRIFEDRSFLILLSTTLVDVLIAFANAHAYLLAGVGQARRAIRRRTRESISEDVAGRLAAVLRWLITQQKMTGEMKQPRWELDVDHAERASRVTLAALLFVIAHELGHVALEDDMSAANAASRDGHMSVTEVQELQADLFALRFLTHAFRGDEELVLWGAFVALMGTEFTEASLYARSNSNHPKAWARYGLIEKQGGTISDAYDEKMRVALLCAIMAARDDRVPMPAGFWSLLVTDSEIGVPGGVDLDTVIRFDRMLSLPVEELVQGAVITPEISEALALIQSGSVEDGMFALGVPLAMVLQLVDDSTILDFPSLVDSFRLAPLVQAFDDDAQLRIAVACARSALPHMADASQKN
jgi:IrrE N-terminal-like domain